MPSAQVAELISPLPVVALDSVHIHRLLFVESDAVSGKTHDLVPGPEEFKGERNVSLGLYLAR